jgi:cyclophilin family peptidyl-prolyl cis-trans isomerase
MDFVSAQEFNICQMEANQMKQPTILVISFLLGGAVMSFAHQPPGQPALPSPLLSPDSPEMNRRAPDVFRVHLETSQGLIVLEIHRDWAPLGVDRFYNLVAAGFYDSARFFRVIKGKWAQFGVPADPKIATVWRTRTLPDDPRKQSNTRGTIAYAFAEPKGRTTQVFFNLRDNSATHDSEPFVPFGKIIEGLDVADKLYADYGEKSGGGIRAGKQDRMFKEGNAYLQKEFPKLDYIVKAKVMK